MDKPAQAATKAFLFLQGPHGPFFHQLARSLRRAGVATWRVGFNAGDHAFWRDKTTYLPFTDCPENWPQRFRELIDQKQITDVVLYGDTRPIHAQSVKIATELGLVVHVFEEGYLRPYWISYERGGSNGHSPLIGMSLDDMRIASESNQLAKPVPPSHWGDMRQHIFYGALYHWFVMFANRRYAHFKPHRGLPVREEFFLYFKRLLQMPLHVFQRSLATRRILSGDFPYHIVLLQLEHDSSFQTHGDFENQRDFLEHVIKGFADGAAQHHHLVFKAHPLENGREPLLADIRRFALSYGVENRLHYVGGGKLAPLLDGAMSAVTVNSTSGQQALWRGLPLRIFGACIYDKPRLVSRQPIADFFAEPIRPDQQSYIEFRDFLLGTSQLPGGYYSRKGRRQLLRRATEMMLQRRDPYALHTTKTEADRQQLRVVK